MAELPGTFDANEVEPNGTYENVPPGDYVVQIVASSMDDNSERTGQFLKLEMDIIEGEQAGRKLYDRLNLVNPNAQAVEIAQRTLSAICHAVNVLTVSDSDELHGRPMIAKVVIAPGRTNPKTGKEYGPSNEIKGYKPVGDGAATAKPATKSGFTANKATPAPASAAPWKRKA